MILCKWSCLALIKMDCNEGKGMYAWNLAKWGFTKKVRPSYETKLQRRRNKITARTGKVVHIGISPSTHTHPPPPPANPLWLSGLSASDSADSHRKLKSVHSQIFTFAKCWSSKAIVTISPRFYNVQLSSEFPWFLLGLHWERNERK